jgi:hypothetical protein
MSEPYPLTVWHYTDYDIGSWIWHCVGCERETAQDWYKPSKTLVCWHCDYELTVHSQKGHKDGYPRPAQHKDDIPYEFMVTLTNAPTRAELLAGHDAHTKKLWEDLERLRGELFKLVLEHSALGQDHLHEVAALSSRIVRASKDVELKSQQCHTYQESWKKRGL